MAQKLPRNIEIFGKKFKIIKSKDLHEIGIAGRIHYDNSIIEISTELDDQEMLQTLLHECFHGIFRRCSIIQANVSHDIEEVIVDSFSTWLVENFDFKL